MGTRYEDQPPEHWAGPESLDPTPVWKQFALIGGFLASTVFGMTDAVSGINVTSIIVAFVGAVILVLILRALPGRSRV